MNTLDYLLKANLYGLLFVGTYWLMLRRHTFFRLNRAYLLVSAALSLILPLASLPTQTVETLPIPVGLITLPAPVTAIAPVETIVAATQPDWMQLGLMFYGLVALFFGVRFLRRVGGLLRLIHQSTQRTFENYILVQPNDPTLPTFSFFRYVILNPADTRNDLILQHELVHVRQYHSVDIVIMEIIQAVFWACPTLWLMDRLLRQVHEFLADKPVHQPTEYAHFLVDYSFSHQNSLSGLDTLTNSFFSPSLLKQRIVMLHRKATNRWALSKYALVLPLAFSLLAMTTARDEITAVVDLVADEPITVSGRVTSAVDGKPLSGAMVVIKATTKGTSTDAEGRYKLINVPKDAVLAFSFVGFSTQEVTVSGQTTHNVSMALQTSNLNKVIVTAYEATHNSNSPSQSTTANPGSQINRNSEVFTVIEQQPEFPGGMIALERYLAQNLRYPADAQKAHVEGYVFVQFVVNETGAIHQLRVLRGIGFGCNEEAVRVVSQMPKWIPGKQLGRAVAAQYNLPIQFVIEKKEDKRTGQLDPPVFKPTENPTGEFPTVRDVNYPNQPRLTTVKIPATAFHTDTVPQPSIRQKPATVTIRGEGPLGQLAGEPLYILDGNQISGDSVKALNLRTVESINVLKGSSAMATYGEKARDGAVILTTKKR
ncbi:TonB family protein [Spirosoma validum]|uniref:TonB family protein n=1 Tax=Spirosoma validum TaxID=2771355 RepID=A0A927B662_9BACT|nr:TonB family protein [Spirosoma validum]MBD2756165.1 TonB family protein [Spirosoma validum]